MISPNVPAELSPLGQWREWQPRRHVLAMTILLVVTVARFAIPIASPGPLQDEAIYLEAFELIEQGRSPYETAYYYLPIVAQTGAWLEARLGEIGVLALMRTANLLGLVATVWIALAPVPLTWRRRVAVGAAYLIVAPAVRLGVSFGNLSLLVAGLTLAALLSWQRWPIKAGLALALSTLVKPLAPAAILVLGGHRPAERARLVSHLVAAAVAVIIVAVAVIAAADLDTFLGQSERGQAASRNVSLHRLLFCFGIAPSPFVIAVVATLLALAVARSRRCSPHEVLVIATTAAIAATPLVWSHTLLLVLPVQTAALVTAFIEYRRRRPGVFLQWCGPVLVCVGVLALQLCEGVGGIDDQPLWTMGLVTAPAALAPLAMAAYVFTRSRTTATGHDARQ